MNKISKVTFTLFFTPIFNVTWFVNQNEVGSTPITSRAFFWRHWFLIALFPFYSFFFSIYKRLIFQAGMEY
jgi:hypothetical protein